MNDYRLTPEAEDDLFEIWRYIARDSVTAANGVESAIHDACFFLAQEPRSGSPRRHVTSSSFLDGPEVSELGSCLPSGNSAAGNCSRPAWHARSQAHAQILKSPLTGVDSLARRFCRTFLNTRHTCRAVYNRSKCHNRIALVLLPLSRPAALSTATTPSKPLKSAVRTSRASPIASRFCSKICSVLRTASGESVRHRVRRAMENRRASPRNQFRPARVLLQDFTGVPCVVDLAAMRDALRDMGADPKRANPLIPVDLVIDHSVQVDQFGTRRLRLQRAARISAQ